MSEEEESSDVENQSTVSEATTSKSEKQPIKVLKPDIHIYNSSTYKVYKDYSCRLEKRDTIDNQNKFYLIQLLEKNQKFYVYSRWGRKGKPGQQRMTDPHTDKNECIAIFEKRFSDKTGLDWNMRDHLDSYTGVYKILENDLSLQSLKNEKDPFEKAKNILLDICFEINILQSDKTGDIIKDLSNDLFTLFPNAFPKKKSHILDSNQAVQQAFKVLNDYRSKYQGPQKED